jgi:hypothetical protein
MEDVNFYRINDDKGGQPSIDGLILNIPREPLVEPLYSVFAV